MKQLVALTHLNLYKETLEKVIAYLEKKYISMPMKMAKEIMLDTPEPVSPFAEKVLIFIDEPILSALGTSTYIGVSNQDALRMLRETVSFIKEYGGIAGIHCCGKADWPLVLSSEPDVFNYDSFDLLNERKFYFFWNFNLSFDWKLFWTIFN